MWFGGNWMAWVLPVGGVVATVSVVGAGAILAGFGVWAVGSSFGWW